MTNNHDHPDLAPIPQNVISERLIIRPSTRADSPYLQVWWNDPDVMGPGGNPDGMQYDDDAMEDWFQRHVDCRNCANHFIIALRQTEKPIGEFYIACDDRPGAIDFAVIIGDTEEWGKGYATEAVTCYAEAVFASRCCAAMRVNVRRDNAKALDLFYRVGFEVEHVWANGLFLTLILTQAAFELKKYKRELSETEPQQSV